MSYNWQNGELITAEKLNQTGDSGFECDEISVVLTDETVTTAADPEQGAIIPFANLSYSEFINADTIKVTFDGVEYVCARMTILENTAEYGASWDETEETYDFSTYPFAIYSDNIMHYNQLSTPTAGTHSVKIESVMYDVQTTECFKEAVNNAVEIPLPDAPSYMVIEFSQTDQSEQPDVPEKSYSVAPEFGAPSVADIYAQGHENIYRACYMGHYMDLADVSQTRATFSGFNVVTLQLKKYIRHYVLDYRANGQSLCFTYDIEIPTAY